MQRRWRTRIGFALAGGLLRAAAGHAAVRGEYVPGSTRRIASLTGASDPEGLPHPNNTLPWGVEGTDLGASTDHHGKLFFFFGDVRRPPLPGRDPALSPPPDADLIASATDTRPEPNGVHLTPVRRPDGLFEPYQMRFQAGETPIPLLTNETPTGAFSYKDRLYVFSVHQLPGGEWASYLTSSGDPGRSGVYDVEFELSRGASARFLQVAPWVVKNREIPGLPSSAGDGLIMAGQAGLEVSLAWMPLTPGRRPQRSQIRYWTGSPDPAGRWSPAGREELARPLFHTRYGWTSLSLGRIEPAGAWILLSQTAFGPTENPDGPIVARVAAAPWELAQAEEIAIFDPRRDDPSGRFLHRPGGFAYGAYLLNRYTRWNARERTVTFWYLLSPSSPYQVQLMRSQIRIAPGGSPAPRNAAGRDAARSE